MGLKTYDRQVNFEVAYIPIERENFADNLMEALIEFGTDDVVWTVEPSYIVLSRQMATREVPIKATAA